MANRLFNDEIEDLIIVGYLGGASIQTLATDYKCSSTAIWNILRRNNIARRVKTCGSTKPRPSSRVNVDSALVCADYDNGASLNSLSLKYGCSCVAINNVLIRNQVSMRARGSFRKSFFNIEFFDKIDTEHKAYVLGMLYADGYHSESNTTISLSLIDKQIVEEISEALSCSAEIKEIHRGGKVQYRVAVSSKYTSNRLLEIGLHSGKSLSCDYPCNFITPALAHHFARGYFDGDGSIFFEPYRDVRFYQRVTICGTFEFLTGLNSIMPVQGKIRLASKNAKIHCLYMKKQSDIVQFRDWLYADSTIKLDRKKNRFYSTAPDGG